MNSRLRLAALLAVWGLILGGLVWLGAGDKLRQVVNGRTAAASGHGAIPTTVASDGSRAANAVVTPETPRQTVFAPPFSSEQERLKSLDDRKAMLPVFLKVADESIAKQRKDIDAAKQRQAPSAVVAGMEDRLQQMVQARQQVLARNADVAMAR